MDIDFVEFEAMDGLSRDFPAESGMELPIGQFMVEIHLTNGATSAAEYLKWYVILCSKINCTINRIYLVLTYVI